MATGTGNAMTSDHMAKPKHHKKKKDAMASQGGQMHTDSMSGDSMKSGDAMKSSSDSMGTGH
jgi:hypothetical protein